jgi:hypothetical protein
MNKCIDILKFTPSPIGTSPHRGEEALNIRR